MKVVSLFSGCGGLDLGFAQAGHHIVWANDNFKDAVETYKNYWFLGNHIHLGDIKQFPTSVIPDHDILIGGFPCTGFSIANKNRSIEDQRNFLYLELLRVLREKRPSFFVAENVKGILSLENGEIFRMIMRDFGNLGYQVNYSILNSADYGVPQKRERVIIMGNRVGQKNEFPIPTHTPDQYVSVKEAIGHLSAVRTRDTSFQLNGLMIHNHQERTNVADFFYKRCHDVKQSEVCDFLRRHRERNGTTIKEIDEILGYKHTAGHWFRKDKYGSIPRPEDWISLANILGFDDDHMTRKVTEMTRREITFEQNLRVSNWDTPSDTITATNPEIHPNGFRRLSARECAILQSFPDDFVFSGSLSSIYKQIGNAVPVLMAKKIGEIFAKK